MGVRIKLFDNTSSHADQAANNPTKVPAPGGRHNPGQCAFSPSVLARIAARYHGKSPPGFVYHPKARIIEKMQHQHRPEVVEAEDEVGQQQPRGFGIGVGIRAHAAVVLAEMLCRLAGAGSGAQVANPARRRLRPGSRKGVRLIMKYMVFWPMSRTLKLWSDCLRIRSNASICLAVRWFMSIF